MYRLVGVVVHSGQANGGHYFSYICERKACEQADAGSKWTRFDDGEVRVRFTVQLFLVYSEESLQSSSLNAQVTEAEYLDRAAMERDWFGGEYYTSVYDNV